MNETSERFDTVGFVMDYEGGALGAEETVRGFAHLIASGVAWQLQGHYGRTAAALIEAGLVSQTGEVDEDALAEALID